MHYFQFHNKNKNFEHNTWHTITVNAIYSTRHIPTRLHISVTEYHPSNNPFVCSHGFSLIFMALPNVKVYTNTGRAKEFCIQQDAQHKKHSVTRNEYGKFRLLYRTIPDFHTVEQNTEILVWGFVSLCPSRTVFYAVVVWPVNWSF